MKIFDSYFINFKIIFLERKENRFLRVRKMSPILKRTIKENEKSRENLYKDFNYLGK